LSNAATKRMKPAMVTITRENNTRSEKAEYISIPFLVKGKNVLSSLLESFRGGQEGDKKSLQSIKEVLRRVRKCFEAVASFQATLDKLIARLDSTAPTAWPRANRP